MPSRIVCEGERDNNSAILLTCVCPIAICTYDLCDTVNSVLIDCNFRVFMFIKSDNQGKANNGLWVYQPILKSMKVFPYNGYLKLEVRQEIDGKGKRKASDGAELPPKKVTLTHERYQYQLIQGKVTCV